MLSRTLYLDPPTENRALWLSCGYCDTGLTREEIITTSGESDAYYDWRRRVSPDNGRTWSAFTPMENVIVQRDDGGIVYYPSVTTADPRTANRYCARMRRIWPGGKVFEFSWSDLKHPFNDHAFVIENDGTEKLMKYEEGPDYDPENPFDPEFSRTNHAYLGQRLVFSPDGTVYFPIIANREGEDPNQAGVILMRRDPRTGEWLASNRIQIDPKLSWRGLLEPDLEILKDGRIFIVCRAAKGESSPCRKWFISSTDGGKTLSPAAELRYDDGSSFFSPGSIHCFYRSSKNNRLYWVANIVPQPDGDGPRYPLYITEIDEDKMAVRKNSLVLVDDRRIEEGDTDKLQLSNFTLVEDRETLNLEIYITRIGQSASQFWHAGVHKYLFEPPA